MGSRTTSATTGDRRWLRLGPAAQLLGVSITTLRRWSDDGKLPCYRSAGGHRRFRRSDIDAILAGQAGGAAGRRAPRPPAPVAAPRAASSAAGSDGDGHPDGDGAATHEIARLQLRNRELELLVEAGIEDASRLSTKEVLESVASRLSRVTHSPVADIYAVEGDSLRALVSYDQGQFDRSWEETVVRLRDFPCSVIAVDERRIAVASSLDDPVLTDTGRESLAKWGYQAQLSAPLIAHGDVIGILELSDYTPRDFHEHLELITGLAHVAGRALENAALFEEIRRRNVILHELVELGALVTGAHDVTELLRAVAQRLVEALGVADCDVFTLNGDQLFSHVSYDRSGYDDEAVGHSLRIEEFPNTKTAIETQQIAVTDLSQPGASPAEREVFDDYGFRANLSLPLVVDGVVHGLIDIYDDVSRDFSEYLDFLTTVGSLIAGALEKTVLLERLERGNDELQLLVASGLEFGATLELDEVLLSVAERIRAVIDADVCEVYGVEGGDLVTKMCVGRNGLDETEIGLRRRLSDRPAARRAIESREPFAIEDAASAADITPEEREYFTGVGYPASMRIPLVVRGDVIGLVGVYDTSPRTFERVQLLRGLAQIAAQAMANAELLDQVKHRAAVLSELVDLGALIWRERDVDSVVHTVAPRLAATIGAASCEIYRRSAEGHTVCLASYSDRDGGCDSTRVGEQLAPPEAYANLLAALDRNEPFVVTTRSDPRLSPEEREVFERWGLESELCIPVAVEDRVVGLIDVLDTKQRDFHEYVDFTRSVGQMVAGAFENASLLERLNDSNRELETLAAAGLEFSASLDLDHVLTAIADRMIQITGSAFCDIYEVREEALVGLLSADQTGIDADWPGTTYALADLGELADAVREGELVTIADARNDERVNAFVRRDWQRYGIVSALWVPVQFGGRVTGLVGLFDQRPRAFEHVDLIRGLAQIAAQAMANATLYRRLDESSRRLSVVNEASLELSSTLELRDILLATAHRLCEIGRTPACEIFFVSGRDLLCVTSVRDGEVVDEAEGTLHSLDLWASEKLAIANRATVQLPSLEDLRRSPGEVDELRALGYEGELIVPLIAKDRVIGVAELLDTGRREFSRDAVATVESVCRAAALAIDNANLFEGMQLRRRETELLNAIARRTASSLRLDEIAGATVDELRQLIPFERACLALTAERGGLELIYSSERWIGNAELLVPDDQAVAACEAVRHKRVVVWEPGEVPTLGEAPAAGAAGAGIALLRGEDLIGVLSVTGSDQVVFSSVDRRLLERVGTHLSLAINNARLYDEIKRMHLGNLKALSSALNAKDYYTLGHAARVGAYMVLLAHELGWPDEMVRQVEEAAYLHDIGKIGVSDRVLLKPSGLNSREWDLMRQHPIFSAEIIRPLFSPDLVLGVRHHHERWDGGGYPDGLAGDDIPLVARAMCVVDSYDAMSFRRPYRQALWYHEALAELDRCRGTQFDPAMVDAFWRVLERLERQRAQAKEIAALAAARVDATRHRQLREPADEGSPAYHDIAAVLRDVRDGHPPVRFVTTHARVDDNKYVIVVDPEEDPAYHSPLGAEVFADEELPEVFAGAHPDVNVLYVDEWGVWVIGLAPIVDERGEVVAVVSADLPPAGASGTDMEGLRSEVAQTYASMLQTTAARLSRAELDAITDGLTGLYNHRYLHERLSEEIERAREQNRPLSLLFCDIDQFKAFNDLYGHSAGDSALRGVARAIDSAIRRVDLAARYGGEEFAVILIETDGDGALEVAQRIRHDVAAGRFVQGKDAALTVSIGVASFPEDAGMKEELLDKADWAMYVAKRQGRDKVVRFAAGQAEEKGGADGLTGSAVGRTGLSSLADAVDAKLPGGGSRSREAGRLAGLIAAELKLGTSWVDAAVEAARLCDIGQIALPDDLLAKPAELSADEWRLVREHPVAGERLLRSLGAGEQLAQAVAHHHERYDGAGYPSGLAGDGIPLHSRIVLVAAAYAAMTGTRAYAPRLDRAEALAELRRCSGTQFDPNIVEALERALLNADEAGPPRT